MNADVASAERPISPTQPDQADFLSLAETLSSLIALIRGDKIIYANPAACALLGRPKEEIVGRNFWELVHPEDRERAIERGRARAAGVPREKRLIERLVHADGRAIWMDYSVDVVRFEGQPATLVTGHDVTERRRMEEELRLSEQRLAEAQRIAHIGSWDWDVANDTIRWSEELCRIYGVAPEDFGTTLDGYLDMVHPEDRGLARHVLEQALRRGGPFSFEHRVLRTDGTVRTIFGRGEVFVDRDGRPVRVAGTGQDITERRRMEEELRRSDERFRLAFTHAAIGKAIISPDWRILEANPAACSILGYGESELVTLPPEALTLPEDRAKTEALVRRLLEGPEVSGAIEKRFVHRDGHVVWTNLHATLVRDAAGRPLYFIAEFEDVTQRKAAEEALRASEARFRNLLAQAPVLLMSFGPDGLVRDVSDWWLQTFGYTREEIEGRCGFELLTPDSQERLQRAIEENQRNRQNVIKNLPLRVLKKDGSALDLLATSVADLDESGVPRGAICVQVDLTDLKRAEAALRESEERYRALVEHAPEAIMVLDVDQNRYVDVNAHAEKLFGYSRERLLTMGPLDFCCEDQAGGRPPCEILADEHRRVLEGETSVFEFTHVDAEGRRIVCQTRLTRLPAEGRRLIRTTITDISELKQLQEKVRHADRLAAVGVLAAGVAHEIGNPLMALSMAAQSLERRSCDEYTQKKLALIREHIDRISRIVRQMNDLARPHSGVRGRCDVNEVVRRAVEMVRYDNRAKNAEVRYELAEGLPEVEAVEDELTQVCINLALNAFDAMAANPPDRPRRLVIRSERADGMVRVAFADSGPGFAPELRGRLFQPFFTTKDPGRGSGLGLSVSYRILQEHGGALRLLDDAGPGATFVFELPLGERP